MKKGNILTNISCFIYEKQPAMMTALQLLDCCIEVQCYYSYGTSISSKIARKNSMSWSSFQQHFYMFARCLMHYPAGEVFAVQNHIGELIGEKNPAWFYKIQ